MRAEKGFTQASLAAAMSASGSPIERGYVQKLESGKHQLSDDMLERLCQALACEPWEIVPQRYRLSDADVEALTIHRRLLLADPARRERWIETGEDALKAVEKP
ncbi:helix-turn-helix domain-containing protein [Azospirillum rugosum]|uniref:Transcriptional regulator with XRE-family HTH domain n=1 Tax=Azospirillum rugosum TaxID=416170 RepID=A0ABS4SDV4_9PROT|nr:helix-turn-helix transcriptional regulator [Azospirillum rugosum]MBP2290754.1 transcriptional regulator with XRE-family HTH domain [Azospirillum rugosum]MDQ0525643.1 transcriptional regulator with XRE-family HTH domain [Azospirillum rugosum]